MPRSEHLPVTMPDEFPTANKVARVDPNNGFPSDATAHVFTEDGHLMTFRMFKKGPQQSEYLISLMDSKPPVTTYPPSEKEVYVKNDVISKDAEFSLDSMFPIIIGRATFKAIQILSNIETIVIPLDGRPTDASSDIQEVI